MPSRSSKYGIKVFALVDASMFYTGNIEICVGTQPEGPYKISNNPADVETVRADVWIRKKCDL
jgi:hypothetical protein